MINMKNMDGHMIPFDQHKRTTTYTHTYDLFDAIIYLFNSLKKIFIYITD